MSSKQQLPALDSCFLSMETEELPGHIGGLAILDPSTHPEGNFSYDEFVELVAERLTLCPRFTWRLQEVPFGLDEPYWVEVEDLDLKSHIHHLALPTGAGSRELSELTSYLFERPLDRRRPLWEMFLIEGPQRTALLWKVHHALIDGASGAGLVEQLFDMEAAPAKRTRPFAPETCSAGKPVSATRMLLQAARKGMQRPRALAGHVGALASQMFDDYREGGSEALASAPQTIFNGTVGNKRSVAWSSVSLDRVMRLKKELDVTVNDVVLGITGGAVRRFLDERGELPEESLVAAVPVSLREKGDTELGNKVSDVNVYWGTDEADPIDRVLRVHGVMQKVKESAKAQRVNPMKAMSESLAPGAVNLMSRMTAQMADSIPLPANAVVSNVRMTPVPLFMAGAQIRQMVPISLLPPSQGMNVTVISYDGQMHFGVVADPEKVDNPWAIVDAIPKELMALEEAASQDPRYSD